MADLFKLKTKAESHKCPIHGHPPIITIANDDLSLKACCEEFGKRIQKFIENEILYERLESIKKEVRDGKDKEIISGSLEVYSSFDPTTSKLIQAGNLIFSKQFEEAKHILELLLESISETNYSAKCSIHINLMVVFFKLRNKNIEYLDLCNFHAKKAMIHGHNTGYATEWIFRTILTPVPGILTPL